MVRSRLPPERSQSEPAWKTVVLGAVGEADRTPIGEGIGDAEKEAFRKMMGEFAAFHQVEILTF